MLENQFRVDVAAIARQTTEGRQPGQDLDEALLHACREVHGDRSVAAFEMMRTVLEPEAKRKGVSEEEALRRMASGDSAHLPEAARSMPVVLQIGQAGSLTHASPEGVFEQAREALASGATPAFITGGALSVRRVGDKAGSPGAAAPGKFVCGPCGFESKAPFDVCLRCGQKRERSLWRRPPSPPGSRGRCGPAGDRGDLPAPWGRGYVLQPVRFLPRHAHGRDSGHDDPHHHPVPCDLTNVHPGDHTDRTQRPANTLPSAAQSTRPNSQPVRGQGPGKASE